MAERAHPEDPAFQGTIYEERLRERYAFCVPFVYERDVLDVPCGTGWGSSMLSGYRSLTGLDIDSEAIEYGRAHYPHIRFESGSMTNMPFEDGAFDVVLCLEGIEHVYFGDAQRFLAEASRVLRPDGQLIVTAPLLNDNRHSTNPYHMYEFTEHDLRALLEQWFDLDSFEVIAGGDGPEVRAVGHKRVARREFSPARPAALLQAERVNAWLETVQVETGFRYGAGMPSEIIGTSCGILTLEGLGWLATLAQPKRDVWVADLQSKQDADTGLFRDPLLQQYPVESSMHDEEYLLFQMTYFALQALDALGSAPRHALHFADRFANSAAIRTWLDGLDWSNAWLQSNRVMFVLSFLVFRAEKFDDSDALRAFHVALDWLDEHQDSSGLWGEASGSSRLNAMAAAYHFLPFYEYVRRPISRLNAMIDATLSLQQPDGLFGSGLGGGACEDLDAVGVLAIAAKYTQYRSDDVKRALVRAFWPTWNAQNSDGGFCYARRDDASTYRFSSWEPLEIALRDSDTWATWTRLTTLNTIGLTYPEDLPVLPAWQFRRWPALSYHRPGHEISATEMQTLGRWMRPLPQRPHTSQTAVGVVIPCYNLGLYLYEALASVLEQTLQPAEVVIVDDGSTDDYTRFVLDNLAHPQVRVFREPNRGLPAARNYGIGQTQAPYICCLDADDRLHPTFFEKAVAVLEHNGDVGFVSSQYQEFDSRAGVIAYQDCNLPEMLVTNQAMVSSLFRRAAWERAGGYSEAMTGMHDWDLWVGMLAAGFRGAMLPEVLFDYRVRPGSMYQTTRQPENYARLVEQMVQQHPDLYHTWLAQTIRGWARQFAEQIQYAEGQAQLARQIPFLQAQYGNATRQVLELGELLAGLQDEVVRVRMIAEERAHWITELEAARDYHMQQSSNWQQEAEYLQQHTAALEENMRSLEAERDSLAQEHARLAQERDEIAQERDEIAQERDHILRNKMLAWLHKHSR